MDVVEMVYLDEVLAQVAHHQLVQFPRRHIRSIHLDGDIGDVHVRNKPDRQGGYAHASEDDEHQGYH